MILSPNMMLSLYFLNFLWTCITYLFSFFFWLPLGIWNSRAKNQIRATLVTYAAAASMPDPTVPGQGSSLHPSAAEMPRILLRHSGNPLSPAFLPWLGKCFHLSGSSEAHSPCSHWKAMCMPRWCYLHHLNPLGISYRNWEEGPHCLCLLFCS